MNGFLLDTNIVSELRKNVSRIDPHVSSWYQGVPDEGIFLSVITLGEIRKGVEVLRFRDSAQSRIIETWLESLGEQFSERIFTVTIEIADRWGRLCSIRNLSHSDALIAATADCYGLTVATRNEKDFQNLGVKVFNPFSYDLG